MEQNNEYRIHGSEEVESDYLIPCQNFREQEFGADVAIPLERTQLYRKHRLNFYPVYGDLDHKPPIIRALIHAFLISEAEYERMLQGKSERELDPYDPALRETEGPAVLWIASCISMQMGGIARVLSTLLDEVDAHPLRTQISKMAAFVTGPKSFVLATVVGMTQRPENYDGTMPFFEIPMDSDLVRNMGTNLPQIWNLTVIRDYLKDNRRDFQVAVRETIARRGS